MTGIYIFLLILILPIIAQINVTSTFNKYSKVRSSRGLTADQVARQILDSNGLYNVRIERVSGKLSDHYDPRDNVVRLSDSTYGNSSVAAIGVAAHECGHVCQHAENYGVSETCPHFHTLKKGQSQNYTPTNRVRKNAEISCISWDFSSLPDMFPFTRKTGCFECFLNDVYSVKPRKIGVLSIVPCQQNHALNVPRHVRFDVKWRYCCEIRAWKTIECGFLCVGRSQFGYFRVLT